MPDLGTIAGAGGASLAVVLAPKAIELVRTWLSRRADVQIAEVEARKAASEREVSQRIALAEARSESLGVAERVILASADDHRACREEVAELREEVGHLRVSVVACESKHDAAQAMIDWLRAQVERIDRRSTPPAAEPAE